MYIAVFIIELILAWSLQFSIINMEKADMQEAKQKRNQYEMGRSDYGTFSWQG